MSGNAMATKGFDATTFGLLVGLSLCWSLVTPLSRIGGDAGIPFLFFPAVAALGGVAVLSLICHLSRAWPPVSAAHLRLYLLAGVLGQAAPQVVLFVCVQHIPIGVMALVIATTPLLTFLFAVFARAEGFSPGRAFGLMLGFAGAMLVLVPRGALPDADMVVWVLIGFIAPLAWAASNVWSVVWRPVAGTPRTNALGMMLVSALVLWIAVAITGQWYRPDALGAGDLAMLINALVAGLAYTLYFTVLDRAGPVVMSFVSFLNLGFVTTIGVLFFAERPSLWLIAAGALIVAGLVVIQRSPRVPPRPRAPKLA